MSMAHLIIATQNTKSALFIHLATYNKCFQNHRAPLLRSFCKDDPNNRYHVYHLQQ